MTTHQEPDILAQLERLNLKTDNNATAITQLAEIVRYQVMQAERDRQTFQSNFTAITEQAERDRQQATQDRQHFQNAINQINQQAEQERLTTRAVVRELVENAEADRLALLDSITENREKIDTLTQRFDRFVEQAAADRQQAAIDRQQFQRSISELTQQFQTETRRIWEYLYLLQGRNGNSPQ